MLACRTGCVESDLVFLRTRKLLIMLSITSVGAEHQVLMLH